MIKMYMNVKNSDTKKIKIETYYSKNKQNWFNGKYDERGYYVSALLVEVVNKGTYTVESYTIPSSGYKILVKAVTRASKKQEEEADKQALQYINTLVDKICAENNIEIE